MKQRRGLKMKKPLNKNLSKLLLKSIFIRDGESKETIEEKLFEESNDLASINVIKGIAYAVYKYKDDKKTIKKILKFAEELGIPFTKEGKWWVNTFQKKIYKYT